MTNSLQNTINTLSSAFALAVCSALRCASLQEVLDLEVAPVTLERTIPVKHQLPAFDATKARRYPAKKAAKKATAATPTAKPAKAKTRVRRSADDIATGVARVVATLKKSGEGLRAEHIRAAIGVEAKEMPKLLKAGLAAGTVKIASGQKRSTVYVAA